LLKNVIKSENVEDLEGAVETLLKNIEKEQLLSLYKIDYFNTPKEFLYLLAKKLNRMKHGGVFNLEETAKILIRDWN
jgi:nuclear GTP-binding protein